jgi:hypothetical protein
MCVCYCSFNTRRIALLEISQYLENYLWPNFDEKSSFSLVMSMVCMVNEKYREGVPVWKVRFQRIERFRGLCIVLVLFLLVILFCFINRHLKKIRRNSASSSSGFLRDCWT